MPFVKGQSGNPSGRPKQIGRVVELAQSQTENAIATLVNIMNDKGSPPSARVAAANGILDRGWGRPAQSVEVGGDADKPVVHEIVRRIVVSPSRAIDN